jgi:hypothetical protein
LLHVKANKSGSSADSTGTDTTSVAADTTVTDTTATAPQGGKGSPADSAAGAGAATDTVKQQ